MVVNVDDWAVALGAAVGLGYKCLLRYDDLRRARYDDGFFEDDGESISLYLDGRKTAQYNGEWIIIAKPADDSPDAGSGVYEALLRGKARLRAGPILPALGRWGVDSGRAQSHPQFVAYLRAALLQAGVAREDVEEVTAHGLRIGGATEVAKQKLTSTQLQQISATKTEDWLAWYDANEKPARVALSRKLGL